MYLMTFYITHDNKQGGNDMIDIHSHLLFGVDDGPVTIEETMSIIKKAAEEGITDMISTSHAYSPQYNVSLEEVNSKIRLLTDTVLAAGYPVNLHTGHEVRIHEHLVENIKNGKILTLAKSRYLLLELPSHSVPAYTISIIEALLAEGIVPIIAHPERNRGISEKPERLERLVRHGALSQVTAGSLAGHFGKNIQKLSLQLIDANLVHTYGSDVHNMQNRPLLFNEGLNYLEKKGYEDLVDLFLENNACILSNDHMNLLEPSTPVAKKWWKLFN